MLTAMVVRHFSRSADAGEHPIVPLSGRNGLARIEARELIYNRTNPPTEVNGRHVHGPRQTCGVQPRYSTFDDRSSVYTYMEVERTEWMLVQHVMFRLPSSKLTITSTLSKSTEAEGDK